MKKPSARVPRTGKRFSASPRYALTVHGHTKEWMAVPAPHSRPARNRPHGCMRRRARAAGLARRAHKPCSTVLYRNAGYSQYQGFNYDRWPRGIYSVPTFTGTRSAGPIAAAWTALKLLGEDGFMQQVKRVMKTRQILWEGINAIPGLKTISDPELCIFAFESDAVGELAWDHLRGGRDICYIPFNR